MASIGGVLMSGGLINGYSIAAIAAEATQANATAQSALSTARSVQQAFDGHRHYVYLYVSGEPEDITTITGGPA